MKIKPEHYKTIRDGMHAVLATCDKTRGDFLECALRSRNEVFHAAKIDGDSSRWVCGTLYPYGVTDDHLATAQNKAIREYVKENCPGL